MYFINLNLLRVPNFYVFVFLLQKKLCENCWSSSFLVSKLNSATAQQLDFSLVSQIGNCVV